MDISKLTQIGLTETQSKAYLMLIKRNSLTAMDLVEELALTRTNAYMVLNKLHELDLAFKDKIDKALIYRPNSPQNLEKISQAKHNQLVTLEADIKSALPDLLDFYHSNTFQPGVRILRGIQEFHQVYEEVLDERPDKVWVIRSIHDEKIYDEILQDFLLKRGQSGTKTQLISDKETAPYNNANKHHKEFRIKYYWLKPGTYTSKTEVMVYNNKTALTTFGDEAISLIIDSADIAESYKQLFQALKLQATETTP